jgi:hypothetical protein
MYKIIIFLISCCISTNVCYAQSSFEDPDLGKAIVDVFGLKAKPFKKAKSKFYLGIRGDFYWQNAYYMDRAQFLKNKTVLPVTFDNSGLFVGYRFYKNFYVEAGVHQYSLSMANGYANDAIYAVDGMPVTSFRYPLRVKYQIEISRKRVFINPIGGLIWSVNSVKRGYGRDPLPTASSSSTTFNGTIETDYAINFGNTFMQELGAGLEFKLSRSFALEFLYTQYFANQNIITGDTKYNFGVGNKYTAKSFADGSGSSIGVSLKYAFF